MRRQRRLAVITTVFLVVGLGLVPAMTGSFDTDRDRAEVIGEPDRIPTGPSSGGVVIDDVADVHEEGVTGEGVRVGVIGRRFDADHTAVADNVADARRFQAGLRFSGDPAAHDTAVAEIVADTAPDADLYLAGVGSRPSPTTYREAVQWLLANDVDVIVDAGSYFPASEETARKMTRVAEHASDEGVVFVTSAGNYADRHWAGAPTEPGWLTFAEGRQGNRLGNGEIEGQVRLRLYWDGDADYDLYLYRDRPGPNDPVVAKSTADGTSAEAIDATVPRGHYYVAIHVSEPGSTPVELDLFAANHPLEYTTAEGSLTAPATGEGVIVVGAVDPATGTQRAYSSRGSTLDITAPDRMTTTVAGEFQGTSAAAPVVAGTAALMEARDGDLTPREVNRILRETAVETGGGLRLDPAEAVAVAGGADEATAAEDRGESNEMRVTVGAPGPGPGVSTAIQASD